MYTLFWDSCSFRPNMLSFWAERAIFPMILAQTDGALGRKSYVSYDSGPTCCRFGPRITYSANRNYSLFLVFMQMVTGPSLTRATFMSAPNSPVPTVRPMAAESAAQNLSYNGMASS